MFGGGGVSHFVAFVKLLDPGILWNPVSFVVVVAVVVVVVVVMMASEKFPARSVQKRHFRGLDDVMTCVDVGKIQP